MMSDAPHPLHDLPEEGQVVLSLAEAQEVRRKAEQDAKVLANRIAMLKQEQLMAMKKTHKLQRDINDAHVAQEEHDRRTEAKRAFQEAKESELEERKARLQLSREDTRERVASARVRLREDRKGRSEIRRQQRETNECAAIEVRADALGGNRDRHSHVQRAKNQSRVARVAHEQHRMAEGRAEYEAKVMQQHVLAQRTEELVRQMEEEERVLMEKVSQTQQMHAAAYNELQQTVASRSRS